MQVAVLPECGAFRRILVLVLGVALIMPIGGCAAGNTTLDPFQFLANRSFSSTSSDVSEETNLKALGERFERDPSKPETGIAYATALQVAGQPDRALTVLKAGYDNNPDHIQLASEYGRLALKRGQVELAARVLQSADDPRRPDWRTISARGVALAKMDDFAGAIPFFERARAVAPDEPSVVNNLAMAYVAIGRLEEAEGLMRRIASRPDATRDMRQNLGLVLALQGRFDAAKAIVGQDKSEDDAARWIEHLRRITGSPNQQGVASAALPTGIPTNPNL